MALESVCISLLIYIMVLELFLIGYITVCYVYSVQKK